MPDRHGSEFVKLCKSLLGAASNTVDGAVAVAPFAGIALAPEEAADGRALPLACHNLPGSSGQRHSPPKNLAPQWHTTGRTITANQFLKDVERQIHFDAAASVGWAE